MNAIQEKYLNEVKEQLGLDLELCDTFTGVHKIGETEMYFNILLKHRSWLSNDYDKIERYCNKYKTFRVESSGVKRLAIIFKTDELKTN